MSCSYRVGGVENKLLNDVFFYVEDTDGNLRDPNRIEQILQDSGLAFKKDDKLVLVDMEGVMEDINHVNETARAFFGVAGDLVKQVPYGNNMSLEIDPDTLERLNPTSRLQNSSVNNSVVERVVEDEYSSIMDPLKSEAFDRKEKTSNLTERIVSNLERQIERLQRLEQTQPVKNRLNEINLLKAKLRKVKKGHETVENFYDYVDYVYNLSQRATWLMNSIEDEYSVSYKTMPNEDRKEILSKISELKQTLDAFYTGERRHSVITDLQNALVDYKDSSGVKDEVLDRTIIAIANMQELNERYLDIAIPIQADVLMEFAPIELNEKLDAAIQRLQKALDAQDYNVPFQGLRKRDPRALKIYKDTGFKIASNERRKALLELNITQLQEQKIGRQAIIKELRETHEDASFASMYTDPLVYSSELTIQLFANAVKAELMDAHQKTIDSKYALEPAFRKFRDAVNISEDRPDKMYEKMLEKITVYRRNTENEIVPTQVWSFVQPHDMNKFQNARDEAFTKLKNQHNFPEDYSEMDEYFRSPEGRAYNAGVAAWYKENTEPIAGAEDAIDALLRERNNIDAARSKAFNEGRTQDGKELSYQYHALDTEIKKVYRRGADGMQIVGKMTVPKMSLYANPKYKAMPAADREYHKVLLDLYKEHQKKIGKGSMVQNPWDDFSYMLPTVRKSGVEQIFEGKILDSAKNMLSDAFVLQETDTDFGQLVKANGEKTKFIPRFFTNVVDSSLISQDATNSLIKVIDMANRYDAKAKMLGVVNIMHDAVASRDVKKMTASGNMLMDRTAQKLGYELEIVTKGKKSRTYKQLQSFIDNVFYGQSMVEGAQDEVLGISKAKAVGFATSMTALARLSGNTLQAANQLIIDSVMGASEGWASQFYSRQDLFRARAIVTKGISTDGIAPKFTKKSKVNKMMEMFDALQEGSADFAQTTGTAVRKHLDFGTAFAFQQGAEWRTTAEKMVAMALATKGQFKDKSGKVIKTKSGEDASLWDLLVPQKNGRLKIDPRVANFGKKELGMFAAKMNGLTKKTNQLKGSFDKTLAERENVGRLLMVFRRFLNPAYRKRFGHRAGGYHVDVEMRDLTEGYYTTVFRSLGSALRYLKSGNVSESVKTLVGRGKGQSALDRQNTIRALHEQFYLSALGFFSTALAGAMSDDEDEDDWIAHFAVYQMYRLKTELNAFRDPYELQRLIENPTAASQLIVDNFELLGATRDHIGYWMGAVPEEEVYYQRRAGRFQAGDAKWRKQFLDVFPIAAGIYKSLDPEEASKYYEMTDNK